MPKTKRAPSAYNLYMRDTLSKVKRENEGISQGDAMKLCSQKWKALSPDEALVYKNKALEAKAAMKEKQEEALNSDDLKGAFARLDAAVASLRSSPKKKKIEACLVDVKKHIQSIYDETSRVRQQALGALAQN